MQATRDPVGTFVELAAGVEGGEHQLRSRASGVAPDTNRDASTVVGDRTGTIGSQLHRDRRAVSGEGFIDGVVDHFIDEVVESL